jgi:uncharacterized membrane protein
MEIQMKHISHRLIDSLSDGVFSIALTLLGLDVVALVSKIGHEEDFNSALFKEWPTFLAYVLGFVVLFSMWYTYHAFGQYTDGTNTWIVWNHGLNMLWVALMPFGVALLADTLNSENRKWGVFYFGICLFGYNFTWLTQWALAGFKFPVTFKEDFPWDVDLARKTLPLFFGASSLIGIILIATSLVNPWIALAGYGLYVLLNVSPVTSMTKLMLRLSTLVNKQA